METLIVLGACCVPLATGAVGLVWWGNRHAEPEDPERVPEPEPVKRTFRERLRGWHGETE